MGVLIETETAWTFQTPHGRSVSFALRPGTSDWNTANSCTGTNDEYRLPTGLSGWALDVGAHIGACTVPLLLDNPDLRVVAIEALPENVTYLRTNLAMNGVEDRCVVIERAAGGATRIGYGDATGENAHSRFIGSAFAPEGQDFIEVGGVTLDEVLERIAAGPFVWCKIDCEGCEYRFFDSPFVRDIAYITGEHHFGYDRVKELLEATHEVTMLGGTESFGHFEAVRR